MPKRRTGRKMLVTGAAGFVGSHLCRALSDAGHAVIAADLPRAGWWRHEELAIPATRVHCDLADVRAVAALARRGPFDTVFHLASTVDVRRDKALVGRMLETDLRATAHVLTTLAPKARRVVLAGTCEEYGDGPAPFRETQREVAVSPYAWSKISATHLGQLFAKAFDAPVVVVRPFLTYGPLQTSTMLVPAAIRAALAGARLKMTRGDQTREFNYVTDIVAGLIAVAGAPGVVGHVINLGSGRPTRVATLARLVYKLCNSAAAPKLGALPYRIGETMRFFSDTRRARKLVRWTPRTTLVDGLRLTIAWVRGHHTHTSTSTRA